MCTECGSVHRVCTLCTRCPVSTGWGIAYDVEEGVASQEQSHCATQNMSLNTRQDLSPVLHCKCTNTKHCCIPTLSAQGLKNKKKDDSQIPFSRGSQCSGDFRSGSYLRIAI
jgi:hypothetical protein